MSATDQNRVQPGVPEGGQFAASQRSAPDSSVVLTDAPRTLPENLRAGVPSDAEALDLASAAFRRARAAQESEHEAIELQLAAESVSLYEQHGVTGFTMTLGEGSEGLYTSLESVETDDGLRHEAGMTPVAEAVEYAVSKVGVPPEMIGEETGERTFDTVDLIQRAPELASRVRAAAPQPLRASDVVHLATVLSFAQQEQKVRWTDDDGDTIRTGTMRTGTWGADGLPRQFDDIREARLRITTDTGLETFRPVPELAAKLAEHTLAQA